MAKTYWIRFGFGDPRNYSGLSPTLLIFKDNSGNNISAPAVAEVGTGTGLYAFSFNPTLPIAFLADAATTSPGVQGRYVVGNIDPDDVIDAAIGSTASSFGDSSTDPVDLFGYLKRVLENLEGNNIFTKPSGALQILSRGSSVLLTTKTIANSVSTVIKT